MALPDLTTIDLGYISGQDLMQYLPVQFLQQIYADNSGIPANTANIFQRSAKIGRDKVKSYFNTIYDIELEFNQPAGSYLNPATDARNGVIVQLVTFFACWEIARNSDNIENPLKQEYEEIMRMIGLYQTRQADIAGLVSAPTSIRSDAYFVNNIWKQKR